MLFALHYAAVKPPTFRPTTIESKQSVAIGVIVSILLSAIAGLVVLADIPALVKAKTLTRSRSSSLKHRPSRANTKYVRSTQKAED